MPYVPRTAMSEQTIEGFGLSSQQRLLWRLKQATHAYWAQCVVIVRGELDEKRFDRAIDAITERHPMLRTTFFISPGMSFPIQVIGEGNRAQRRLVDCRFGRGDASDCLARVLLEER